MIQLLAQVTADDPGKLFNIAKSISDQSDRFIMILLLIAILLAMGYMLRVFLKKIDEKDSQIIATVK